MPGDKDLDEYNKVETGTKKYYPIKKLRPDNKIGVWEKHLSGFLKETLATSLENSHFRKKIRELSRLFPRFHRYLSGKEGKVYQDILLSKKRARSIQ